MLDLILEPGTVACSLPQNIDCGLLFSSYEGLWPPLLLQLLTVGYALPQTRDYGLLTSPGKVMFDALPGQCSVACSPPQARYHDPNPNSWRQDFCHCRLVDTLPPLNNVNPKDIVTLMAATAEQQQD